jgi:hypothetical protein
MPREENFAALCWLAKEMSEVERGCQTVYTVPLFDCRHTVSTRQVWHFPASALQPLSTAQTQGNNALTAEQTKEKTSVAFLLPRSPCFPRDMNLTPKPWFSAPVRRPCPSALQLFG